MRSVLLSTSVCRSEMYCRLYDAEANLPNAPPHRRPVGFIRDHQIQHRPSTIEIHHGRMHGSVRRDNSYFRLYNSFLLIDSGCSHWQPVLLCSI